MGATDLLGVLWSAPGINQKCDQIFCSTCGGMAAIVLDRRSEYIEPIKNALATVDLDDLRALGEWLSVIVRIAPKAVSDALLRVSNGLGGHDIGSLDKFIYLADKYKNLSPQLSMRYEEQFSIAKQAAIETANISLLETLVLVMGTNILTHNQLLSVALAHRDNPIITKALYNRLRQDLPLVRTYRGTSERN